MKGKVNSQRLETGVNKLKVPPCTQILGFDAVGSLRVIYDAPLFNSEYLEGLEEIELHVVPVGDTFEIDDDSGKHGYQFLATATPPAKRPVAIYQVWTFHTEQLLQKKWSHPHPGTTIREV